MQYGNSMCGIVGGLWNQIKVALFGILSVNI